MIYFKVSCRNMLPHASIACTLLQAVISVLPASKCLPQSIKAASSHFSSDAYVQMALHGGNLRRSFVAACQLLHRHHHRLKDCQGAAHAAVMPGKVGLISTLMRLLA